MFGRRRTEPQASRSDIAKERIRTLQTTWSHFDVGAPEFYDHAAHRVRFVLDPDARERLEEIPVALLHSHLLWSGPEVTAFEYSDGIRFVAIDYRFVNLLNSFNLFVVNQLLSEEEGDDSSETFDANAVGALSQFGRLNGMMLPFFLPSPINETAQQMAMF